MQCNSGLVALHQVTLITPRRPSTGTPACQSRTRPTATATSARTAPRTRTRTSRTRSSHIRRRRRSRLRRRKLRRTSCRPRPRPPSRAYTPGTGVEGPRRVRGRDGTGRPMIFFLALNYRVLKHSSHLCPGVLSSLCSTCVRNGKRVLAPVSSLVTLLFSSVLWLRSKAKSPQGEGMKQISFALHHSDS